MAITPGKLQTQSSAHALVIRPDTTPAKYLSRLLIYAVIALVPTQTPSRPDTGLRSGVVACRRMLIRTPGILGTFICPEPQAGTLPQIYNGLSRRSAADGRGRRIAEIGRASCRE